jgi:DNA-binding GntR family transcriptional regulator
VREALITLQAEGVVTYASRLGYAVARFNTQELREIYLMRALLEREMVSNVDLSQVDVGALDELNDALDGLDDSDSSLWEHKRLNREFHFALFRLAAMPTVLTEVERLWNLSEFYRSLYAYETDHRHLIADEHRRIIGAIRSGDRDLLLSELDVHRSGALNALRRRLRGPSAAGEYVSERS